MATTGELRAIIEELELVDIGDAASYLGEEDMLMDESTTVSAQTATTDAEDTKRLMFIMRDTVPFR